LKKLSKALLIDHYDNVYVNETPVGAPIKKKKKSLTLFSLTTVHN